MKHAHEFDPQYNRNLILTFTLICVMMGMWYYFYEIPHRRDQVEQRNKAQAEVALQQAELQKLQAQREAALAAGNIKSMLSDESPLPREKVISVAERVKISTPKLHGSINLDGARIDDITLANYKQTLAKDSPEVILLSPSGSEEPAFVESGWVAENKAIAAPNSTSVWKVEGNNVLTTGNPVTIEWDNGAGFTFRNTYSVDANYMFVIKQSITNNSANGAGFYPYGLINKVEPKLDKPPVGVLHTGPLGVMDKTLTEVSYKSLRDDKKVEFPDSTGWVGITDKYWAKALIPQQDEKYKANFRYTESGKVEKFQVDYLGGLRTVAPGATVEYNTKLLAGAKELQVLESYTAEYKIPLFDRLIDFGWLYFLTKPLMHALIYFYHLIGNYGLAILALTFCVKLVLFPLARKSYISMGKIRDLTPKLQAIRERYKDDKMEVSKKTMELYKKEKVNPAAGCLPILLQMPIFFALYKVFYVSIEMRHTPFFGWISDLSSPDPTSFVNLFGLLPFIPPSFLMIGAWPCIWAVSMYVQQLISPPIADPTQAKVMKMLPLFLCVLFATMPAGLVIYWTFSNIMTIAQQAYFLKFHGTRVAPGKWKD